MTNPPARPKKQNRSGPTDNNVKQLPIIFTVIADDKKESTRPAPGKATNKWEKKKQKKKTPKHGGSKDEEKQQSQEQESRKQKRKKRQKKKQEQRQRQKKVTLQSNGTSTGKGKKKNKTRKQQQSEREAEENERLKVQHQWEADLQNNLLVLEQRRLKKLHEQHQWFQQQRGELYKKASLLTRHSKEEQAIKKYRRKGQSERKSLFHYMHSMFGPTSFYRRVLDLQLATRKAVKATNEYWQLETYWQAKLMKTSGSRRHGKRKIGLDRTAMDQFGLLPPLRYTHHARKRLRERGKGCFPRFVPGTHRTVVITVLPSTKGKRHYEHYARLWRHMCLIRKRREQNKQKNIKRRLAIGSREYRRQEREKGVLRRERKASATAKHQEREPFLQPSRGMLGR